MMKQMIKKSKGLLMAGLLVVLAGQPAAADSLYEYYTTASQEELETETRDMGRQLRDVFDQNAIGLRQRQIDFAEYYSNLRKLVLFSTKLATYSEYETDLQFAKDNEVFKGLPDEPDTSPENGPQLDRKDFATKKYACMKKNVQEEIDTYTDLIQLSLDTCETLSGNDLSGFLVDQENRSKVQVFIEGKEFQVYLNSHSRLTDRWPELSERISTQLALWKPRPMSLDDPLIDPKVTGAI